MVYVLTQSKIPYFRSMLKYFLLIAFLILKTTTFAQGKYLIDLAGGLVGNTIIYRGQDYKATKHFSYNAGVQAIIKVKAAEEGRAETNFILGFMRGQQRYALDSLGNYLSLNGHQFFINPEVVLRTPGRLINPILGIGINFPKYTASNFNSGITIPIGTTILDSVVNVANTYKRPATPFVSLGLNAVTKVNRRQLDIAVKTWIPLQRIMSQETPIALNIINKPNINLNANNSYLTISLNYYYSRLDPSLW
jgi:hypothetical protein